MIERNLIHSITEHLDQFPAVALLGSRQVGKTTLAKAISKHGPSLYLDLESSTDRNKLSDPEHYLSRHENKLVILDEVQKFPEIFQILRGLIDRGKDRGLKSGRFLLLGSASIELIKQSGESLAGRIAYLELPPLNLAEVGGNAIDTLWSRGGFPDSFLAKNDAHSLRWRKNFINTYLERDIPAFGYRIPAETLRRFWIMLAHQQGGLHNAAQLARGLGVEGKSVLRYLDLLVDLLLVRKLPPWYSNAGKRLVKSPRVYIRDSGIAHALLDIKGFEQLLSHPIAGMSWEGFIIENILNTVADRATPSFYRTAAGAEVDLLLSFPNGELWAIEIKRGLSPKLSKGFYHACEDIKPDKSFVIYSGRDRYPLNKEVEVMSLEELLTLEISVGREKDA